MFVESVKFSSKSLSLALLGIEFVSEDDDFLLKFLCETSESLQWHSRDECETHVLCQPTQCVVQ